MAPCMQTQCKRGATTDVLAHISQLIIILLR